MLYMGKSLVCGGTGGVKLHDLSRIVSSSSSSSSSSSKRAPPQIKQPRLANRVAIAMSATPKPEPEKLKKLEEECRVRVRVPLSQVVADCTNRWFIDTLKAATAGDPSMQLLLSQMYFFGYGVPSDPLKGNAWINKASRSRNSVWKASEAHLGYRTSDSDSNELENETIS